MIDAIPIIDASGEQTGTISVGPNGEAVITGKIRLPWGEQTEGVFDDTQFAFIVPPSEEPPRPIDLERLKESFPSAYDSLVADPRHAAAAARGLAVHTSALALSEAEGIPYEQAITRVLEET